MKKRSAWFFALFVIAAQWSPLSAQSLYDLSTIQEIKITFDFNDWDTRMDTAIAGTESYTIAKTVEINGVTYDSVGVRYKGNSTYSANNKKNPLHIELDHIHGNQAYQGITDLKLSNVTADPTFVRESMSYWVLGHYMHCPRANFAKVYINGAYYGLMTNVENIGSSFLSDHFSSSKGAFFKCTPVGGAGPGGNNNYPTLRWLGADSTLYMTAYEIKSDAGWAELLHLIDTLNNQTASVDKVLDVDRALWMLAFDNLLINLDSYIGTFSQNYYLYRSENNRFSSIVWDLNMSFGSFSALAGGTGGPGGGLDSTGMKNLSPLAVSTNTARPLLKKLLENATYKRMYLAHIRTMLQEMFISGEYLDEALQEQSLIDAAVQADANKFYTYQQFLTNLYWGVSGAGPGPGGGSTPGIVSLMNGRKNYLLGTTEIGSTPPAISDVNTTNAPPLGSEVWVSAKIDGTPIATYLGWRGATTDVFTRVLMYDDGQHHDGASGDGVYGASFIASTPRSEYYIYTENTNAGAFLPARAEHEFFNVETALPALTSGEVVINELLADNVSGTTDPDGELEDWIELYNNTGFEVDLTGIYLSDSPNNPLKWAFPNGTVIPANGYLMVWADEDGSQSGLHANFKLKASGEFVSLAMSDGTILDSISFGQQESDHTFGRFPNGTGSFTAMPPTFSAENKLTIATHTPEDNTLALVIAPNPVQDHLQVTLGKTLPEAELRLFDHSGKCIWADCYLNLTAAEVPVNTLPAGNYVLSVFTKGERVGSGKVTKE